MANKNTRALRKLGRSGVNNGATHSEVSFEVFKGKECVTDFKFRDKNPMNKRKSPCLGEKRRPVPTRDEAAEAE